MRVAAQVWSASSLKRTSHTQVVRPRWSRVARAWITPSVMGRRKLVLLASTIAISPLSSTDTAVDQARRLLVFLAHRHPCQHLGVRAGQQLEAVETVEAPQGAVDQVGTG